MPKSARRPKAVAKKKLAATAKSTFNHLLKNILPGFMKQNPPAFSDLVKNEMDLIVLAPTLPVLVMWKKIIGETVTPEISINEFAVDAFLNTHVSPDSPIYVGVKEQVRYYLWISMVGDEAASAHIQNTVGILAVDELLSADEAVQG